MQRGDKAERALFRSQFNELAKLFCHLSVRVLFAFPYFRAIAKIFYIIIDEIKTYMNPIRSYQDMCNMSYSDFLKFMRYVSMHEILSISI